MDDVIESLDVMPTILDLWGVSYQHHGQQRGQTSGGLMRRQPLRTHTQTQRYLYARSVFATGALEALQGTYVSLDGESLRPFLQTDVGSSRHRASRRRRSYARSELHLPCGLGCCMLNQPYDGLPPGWTRTPRVGPVVQLYVRTKRWAYTAVFLGQLRSGHALRLVDEYLFDTLSDPGETSNLAYFSAYAAPRATFLHTVLRDWAVRLSGPANTSRWERAEWLRQLTGFRKDWWKRRL